MFPGFTEETGSFLWELKFNNERPWFLSHREEFERCLKKPLNELAEETLRIMDESADGFDWRLHISRIYRDARRLFGRGPYKERMWFSIWHENGQETVPCFYFEIGPAEYRWGLGFHGAKSADMEAYRKKISANPAAFGRIARKIEKLNKYVIKGEEYKRAKGDMGPLINKWYNRKWLSLECRRDFGGELFSPELPELLCESFRELLPLYRFMLSVCVSENRNS